PGLARQAVARAVVTLRAPPLAVRVLQHDDELVLWHALLARGAHVRRKRRGGPALTGAGVLAELDPVLRDSGTGILTDVDWTLGHGDFLSPRRGVSLAALRDELPAQGRRHDATHTFGSAAPVRRPG